MDNRRFDAFARALAGASTRRAAVVGAVAALAPLAGTAKPDRDRKRERDGAGDDRGQRGPEAGACLAVGERCGKRSGRNGKPCNSCCTRHSVAQANGKKRCACKAAGTPAGNAAQCCAGRRSAGGFCGACDPGLAECPTGCADLETDFDNCGACGNACAVGQACVAGACACSPGICPDDGCCDPGSQACVAVGAACGAAGTVCAVGGCAACGDAGQPCCAGASCGAGLTCADGGCRLPFGASCEANADCASGICACFTLDCSGGAGVCAAAYIASECTAVDGGGAQVYTPTPGATPSTCARDGGPANQGACGGGMVYGVVDYCFVPIDPAG